MARSLSKSDKITVYISVISLIVTSCLSGVALYQTSILSEKVNYKPILDFSSARVNLDDYVFLNGSDKIVRQNGNLNINVAVVSSNIGSVKIDEVKFYFQRYTSTFIAPNAKDYSEQISLPYVRLDTENNTFIDINPGEMDSGSQSTYVTAGVTQLNYTIPLEIWFHPNQEYLSVQGNYTVSAHPEARIFGYYSEGTLGVLAVHATFTDAKTNSVIDAWNNCTVTEKLHVVFS